MDISQFFLYIPGILVFLTGSGRVGGWMKTHVSGNCTEAGVIDCRHIVKKDKKGRITYNFYDVLFEFVNPQTKHRERHSVKSPSAYAIGQQVNVYKEKGSSQYVLAEIRDESLFHPWITMIGGALLILLALFENQRKEIPAMFCLALILSGAGLTLLVGYVSLKKRGLTEIDAVITDIYARQISKGSKILKDSKFTYYPIVRYELDGKEAIRRCHMNSDRTHTFETGGHIKLYYDPRTQTVMETHARTGTAAIGAVLLILGLLAGGSTLAVVFQLK